MKIGMVSLGCSKNLVDSEKIMGMLTGAGHEIVNEAKQAEVIFVNTCGFINPAKEEAISTILEMIDYKKDKCRLLIVVGCLAKRYKQELIDSLPEVDAVVGVDEYDRLDQILNDLLGSNDIQSWQGCERKIATPGYTAYLKIAEGCSNRCHYCAIPLIRGNYRSVEMKALLSEAQTLAAAGVKELILIAQDTTMYGIDLYRKRALKDLLVELNKLPFTWIRVLYLYPDEIDKELIDTMKACDKVLPYFDIPLQYGSDRMLGLMNRRGTTKSYKETISYIREVFPNAVLRTTMMVGFPGEMKEDYEDMLSFMKEVRFDRLGAFVYSKEEDTVGYTMKPIVRKQTKENRYAKLMKMQEEISLEKSQALVGTVLDILIESKEPLTARYRGRSIYSAPDQIDGFVLFTSKKEHKAGDFVKVKITKAFTHDLLGEELD